MNYQMQLMLLEQQNKKRLMMARQKWDNLVAAPVTPAPAPPVEQFRKPSIKSKL